MRLRHYVCEHKKVWKTFAQLLIYGAHSHTHGVTEISRFNLTLPRKVQSISTNKKLSGFAKDKQIEVTAQHM